jgi:hypothetical protein
MTHTTPVHWPLSGRLEANGLPPVIAEIGRRGASGLLHVRQRSVHRVIQFHEGRVRFASSSNPNDRLGEYLLRAGHVTLNELERALSEQSSGKRIGALLVEAGVLEQQQLEEAVQGQIRAIAFDLLGWSEGTYHFDADATLDDEDIVLDVATTDLLLRGIPAVNTMKVIERGVGTPRTLYRRVDDWEERSAELELNDDARAVGEQLAEGPASVATLCSEVRCSSFEIYRSVWALKLASLIEPVGRDTLESTCEGNFSDSSLAEQLIRLEAAGETGVLHVTRGATERSIMFAAGRCVFATSNDTDDGLVSFLFRRGVISLRDREEVQRRLLSNKRVGTILLELGAIDDDDLQQMVCQQVSEIIYDTLGWEEGEFVFISGPLPHAEEITLHTSAGSLVAEGVRRVTSWTRLLRGCGGVDNPLCLTPRYLEVLDEMEASVAEWEIVNVLKSPQTPRRICSMTELTDLRACQILWTLRLLGAVEESPIEMTEESLDEAELVAAETVVPADREEVNEALRALSGQQPVETSAEETVVEEVEEEEAPPQWEVPAGVEDVILRFNAMHRLVFRAVRTEIGAGAANFVRSCCEKIPAADPDPLEGVQLHSDGSWDIDDLKRVIVEKSIDDPWPTYQAVLDQEFVSLQPHLGKVRAGELKQQIWEIEGA